MSKVHIGMSGWTFEGWRGDFYPKGLPHSKELEFASRKVNSIEVNGTFYSLQRPSTFQRWFDETPNDFCFSIKAPRYITHIRRLKEVDEAVSNFLASGLFCLKRKLGPILWQFPPNVMLKDDRFEKFLKVLPYDSKSAVRLAKKHSSKMDGRTFLKVDGDYPVRHAFEFRHPSFLNPEFIELLRQHGVAWVFAHSGLKSPYAEHLTADFIYARMHGQEKQYKKGYPDSFLSEWKKKVTEWTQDKDAFIYFDTEAKEYAPDNAMNFAQRLNK